MDAKLTRAKSFFMPRSQEDKLRFQLNAFRFDLDNRQSKTQKSSEVSDIVCYLLLIHV